jgi:hypothetical protein
VALDGIADRPPYWLPGSYPHGQAQVRRRCAAADGELTGRPGWNARRFRPGQLSDPHIIRAAVDGLWARLDGSPAASNTIGRYTTVPWGYAVEPGLLPASTLYLVR